MYLSVPSVRREPRPFRPIFVARAGNDVVSPFLGVQWKIYGLIFVSDVNGLRAREKEQHANATVWDRWDMGTMNFVTFPESWDCQGEKETKM